jgi:hypothetical protein
MNTDNKGAGDRKAGNYKECIDFKGARIPKGKTSAKGTILCTEKGVLDIRYIYVTMNRGWYQRREYREPAEPVGGNALSGSWPDCQKPQNGESASSTQTYHRST